MSRIRSLVICTMLASASLLVAPTAFAGHHARAVQTCRTAHYRGGPIHQAKATVRCASRENRVSVHMSLCIARHESGFNRWARNPSSSATGLFQVLDGTWAGWRSHFSKFVRRYKLGVSRTSARNNALLSTRVMRGSYAPWAGNPCV